MSSSHVGPSPRSTSTTTRVDGSAQAGPAAATARRFQPEVRRELRDLHREQAANLQRFAKSLPAQLKAWPRTRHRTVSARRATTPRQAEAAPDASYFTSYAASSGDTKRLNRPESRACGGGTAGGNPQLCAGPQTGTSRSCAEKAVGFPPVLHRGAGELTTPVYGTRTAIQRQAVRLPLRRTTQGQSSASQITNRS